MKMTYGEMEKKFDGKWIYIVNCEFSNGEALIAGIPVVIADMQFENVESGIYQKYKHEKYGRKLSCSFLDTLGLIPSVRLDLN